MQVEKKVYIKISVDNIVSIIKDILKNIFLSIPVYNFDY